MCEVTDGDGNALLVKKTDCAPDTCSDVAKAELTDGAGAVFRQLFVCTAQQNKTLAEIVEECKDDCVPEPAPAP